MNIGDFGEIDKMCNFGDRLPIRQISSSIGIDTTWVNIDDFGEINKIGNFGDLWKL